MASVLEAFGSVSSLTITNLNSLATSATAGWQSDAIDNSSTLYLDFLVQIKFANVNTAPGSSKAWFLYVGGVADDTTSDYGSTGNGAVTGTEGTLTFPDFTANPVGIPLIGVVNYITTNVAVISPVFSVAVAFGGTVPPKFALGIINHSGMTIAASGNYVKVRGVYRTVA